MKRYCTAGIAILLPIILTVMIVEFMINFLTNPFLNPAQALIGQFDFFQQSFLLINQVTLVTISSKVLILLCLTVFVGLIGFLGNIFLMDYLLKLGNNFVRHVPYINKIYKACQDVVYSLFSSSKPFTQVVLVPYPNASHISIGLMTGNVIKFQNSPKTSNELVPVFVPATPNPSVGFLLLFKKEQIKCVNMKVDEAMKFIVSCGIVSSDFTVAQEIRINDESNSSSESHVLSCKR